MKAKRRLHYLIRVRSIRGRIEGYGFDTYVIPIDYLGSIDGKVIDAIIGADAIGEKGKPAEIVGREAAQKLLETINTSPVDSFLADQLIIYMALAEGTSKIITNKLTLHTKTAIEVCKQIIKASFSVVEKERKKVEIICNGIGFENEYL